MRSWSIPMGRYFGVEFRVHLLFLLVLAFVWLTEPALQGGWSPGRGLALTLLLLFSVLAKELVKAAAGVHSGLPLRTVMLLPIGGLAQLDESAAQARAAAPAEAPGTPDTMAVREARLLPGRDARMALVGPLVSAILALLAAGAALAVAPEAGLLAQPHLYSQNLLRSFV
jgi:Zn-dependent protease